MGNMIKEKISEIEAAALESLDYLTETILGTDFVEVPGGIGNDAATYRIYEDGRIHARQEADKKEADKKSSITTETADCEDKKIR